jgi:hypothetical protein
MMAGLRDGRTLRTLYVSHAQFKNYCAAHPEHGREALPLLDANKKAAFKRRVERFRAMRRTGRLPICGSLRLHQEILRTFSRHPRLYYMDQTRDFCRAHGHVETLFGRKCHYPDIKASNASIRSFNTRRDQHTPSRHRRRHHPPRLIRMEGALAEKQLSAQMLLQVHDELILRCPGRRGRRDLAGGAAHYAGRRSRRCCCRCRCRSTRERLTTGTRRIELTLA